MPTPIPPREELEQMSLEELEALSSQVLQDSSEMIKTGSFPGGEEALPPMEAPADAEMSMEEQAALTEIEDPTLEASEAVLAEALSVTQDPKEIIEMLRSQGFEIRQNAESAKEEVEETVEEGETDNKKEEVLSASISEPVNLRGLTKKATANAMKKGA